MKSGHAHSAPGRPSALHTLRIDRPFVPDLLVRKQPPTAFFYQMKDSFTIEVELRISNKVSLSTNAMTTGARSSARRATPSLNARDPNGRDPSDPDFDPCEPGPEIVDRAEREKERIRLRKLQRRGELKLEVANLREPDPEARLPLQCSLMYNNRFPVENPGMLEVLDDYTPEITLGIEGWKATLQLRINEASSQHGNQSFRIRIAPAEPLNKWWKQLRDRTGGYAPAGQVVRGYSGEPVPLGDDRITMPVGRVAVTNTVVVIANEFEYEIRVNGVLDVSQQPPTSWFSVHSFFTFSVALRNSARLKFPPGIDDLDLRCVLLYEDHSLVADQSILEVDSATAKLKADHEASGEWVGRVSCRILQPCSWRRHGDKAFKIKVMIADKGIAELAKRPATITEAVRVVNKPDHELQAAKKGRGRRLPGTLLPSSEERAKWMSESIADQLTIFLLDALDGGDLVEVERCIRAGAPPNTVRHNRSHVPNRTAVHLAVQMRSARSVAMLVGLGADPNFVHAHAMHGLSPLAAACLLLPSDDVEHESHLASLVAKTDPLEGDAAARLIRRLVEQGANPAGFCEDGTTTALNVAVQAGNIPAVEALLATKRCTQADLASSIVAAKASTQGGGAAGGSLGASSLTQMLVDALSTLVPAEAVTKKVKKKKKAKKMSRKQKAAQAQKDAAEAAKRAREAKAKKKKKPISFFDEKPAEPTGSAFAAQLLRQRHAAAFKEQLTEALPRPDPTTSRLPLPESLDRGTMWPRPADAFDEMLSTNMSAAERDAVVQALRREREEWHREWKGEKHSFVEPTELKLARKILVRCATDEVHVASMRAEYTDADRGARAALNMPYNFEEEEIALKMSRLKALGFVRNAVRLQKDGLGPRSLALAHSLVIHGEMCSEIAHSSSAPDAKHKRRYLETGAKSLGEALEIYRTVLPSGTHADRRRTTEILTDILVAAGELGAHYCLDTARAMHEWRIAALTREYATSGATTTQEENATTVQKIPEWKLLSAQSAGLAKELFINRERNQMMEEDVRVRRREMLEATSARKHARPQILADAAALRDLLLRPSHTESLLVLAGPEKMGDAVNFCASLLRLKLLGPGNALTFAEWKVEKAEKAASAAKRKADEEAAVKMEKLRARMRHGGEQARIEIAQANKAAGEGVIEGEEEEEEEEEEEDLWAEEDDAAAEGEEASTSEEDDMPEDLKEAQNGLALEDIEDMYDEFVAEGESTCEMSRLIVDRMVEMGKVPGDVLRSEWVHRSLLEEHLVRSAAMDIQLVIQKEDEEINALIMQHWHVQLPEDAKPDKLGRMPTIYDDVKFDSNSSRLAKRMLGGEPGEPRFGRGMKRDQLRQCFGFWCQKSGMVHKIVENFARKGLKPSDLVTHAAVSSLLLRTYLCTAAQDSGWTVMKVKHLGKQDLLKAVLRHWGLHNVRDGWNSVAKARAKQLLAGKDVKIGSAKAHLKEEEKKNDAMMEKMFKRFNAIDTDGSGLLDYDELRRILKPMGHNADSIHHLLDEFDVDKDGELNLEEFTQLSLYLIVGEEKLLAATRRKEAKDKLHAQHEAEREAKASADADAFAEKEAAQYAMEMKPKRRIGVEARRIYSSFVAKTDVLPMITEHMRHRIKKALRTFKKTALEAALVKEKAGGSAKVVEEDTAALVKPKEVDPTTAVLMQFNEAFFTVFTTLLTGTYARYKELSVFHAWEAAGKAWQRILRETERNCASRVLQRAWRERAEAKRWAGVSAPAMGSGFGAARMLTGGGRSRAVQFSF